MGDKLIVEVDGAFSVTQGTVACADILRRHNNELVEGFLHKLDHKDHLTAELWGCLVGLKRAWDLGEREIILLSDSTEAVQLIAGGDSSLHTEGEVIQELQNMIEWNRKLELQVVSREDTRMADSLAKFALNGAMGLQVLSSIAVQTIIASPSLV
ncbi:uncharacterized protein LOC114755606 [Neltuma alba]|uniref:uncharacterized protein LOC114755606 n=1 Tax=Neltuma alba TaxID=207710 RepID=UPI0010A2DDAB|nr:uncharacterized protein LOC114755606 [Prosopis alba]